jgi:transposase
VIAERGKTSMGWFYGFKLHVIINSKGKLIRLKLTPGNADDRKPMPELCQGLIRPAVRRQRTKTIKVMI